MNLKLQTDPWTDPRFLENQRSFPRAELQRYQGQHIAWSWDGSQILAAGSDAQSLNENLRAAGIDPQQVIYDFVEDPNLSYLA